MIYKILLMTPMSLMKNKLVVGKFLLKKKYKPFITEFAFSSIYHTYRNVHHICEAAIEHLSTKPAKSGKPDRFARLKSSWN